MGHNTSVDTSHSSNFWASKPGFKPILLLIAGLFFVALAVTPPPQSIINLVSSNHPPGYKLGSKCNTITETVNKKLRSKDGPLLTNTEVAQMAKIMVGILFVAAFLWGTEALPIGGTDILVGVMMYFFFILPINEIAKAYMKDAVFFIFGILAVAVGVAKTGLDKRIGLILLSRIKSAKGFAFIFLPTLAVCAGFLSEHALVALLIPVLMGVYKVTCKMYGVEKDRALAVFLLLGVCFAANHGGPGSPAAGGRNAIMVGYLMEYGSPISFVEWMKFGMPFVPLMAVVIGAYMYIRCKPSFKVKNVNPSQVVKAEVARMPKFGGKEAAMAIILVLLVAGCHGPGRYADHRRQPPDRDHDQLYERRGNGCGVRAHYPPHGYSGPCACVEGGPCLCILLFLCQFPGGRHPQQRHRIRNGEGPRNRGKVIGCLRFRKIRAPRDHPGMVGSMVLGRVRVLANHVVAPLSDWA